MEALKNLVFENPRMLVGEVLIKRETFPTLSTTKITLPSGNENATHKWIMFEDLEIKTVGLTHQQFKTVKQAFLLLFFGQSTLREEAVELAMYWKNTSATAQKEAVEQIETQIKEKYEPILFKLARLNGRGYCLQNKIDKNNYLDFVTTKYNIAIWGYDLNGSKDSQYYPPRTFICCEVRSSDKYKDLEKIFVDDIEVLYKEIVEAYEIAIADISSMSGPLQGILK